MTDENFDGLCPDTLDFPVAGLRRDQARLSPDLVITRNVYDVACEAIENVCLTEETRLQIIDGALLFAVRELESRLLNLSRLIHGDIRQGVSDDTEA